jgi:hypothetical protein
MARRVIFTIAALLLAGSAFANADPQPDINLFGVLFLFFAFIAWFCWDDIQAGYSYLEEGGTPHRQHSALMFTRVAPLAYLRDLAAKQRRNR